MTVHCSHCGQLLPQINPLVWLAWEQIPAQCHVKRAIEVACTGKHSLAMLVTSNNLEIDAASLAYWANKYGAQAIVVTPCPCGNYGSPIRECTCAIELIAEHHQSPVWQMAEHADMWIELVEPTTSQKLDSRPRESITCMLARIAKARLPDQSIKLDELDDGCVQLLDAVVRQLDLSIWQIQCVLNVATTIMALAGAKKMHAAYLAEAVQYRYKQT